MARKLFPTWPKTALLIPILVASQAALEAGPPGEWTRITEITGSNLDEAALARTPDGVLHVAWLRKNGPRVDYMHSAISENGNALGDATPIVTGWTTLVNPTLLGSPAGDLHLFFSGIRSTDYGDPYHRGSLYVATSDSTGANWSLRPGEAAQSGQVYESSTAAAFMKDGQPLAAWALHSGLGVHFGIGRNAPDRGIQLPCCTYLPGLAIDSATGEVVLGWYSNATKAHGLLTRAIAPKDEETQFVPDSATPDRNNSLSLDQRMPISGRAGAPGVYVAYCSGYPTCTSVNLWRFRTPTSIVVAGAHNPRFVNIAQGPEGRLWVMWVEGVTLNFMRSNRAATRFGPVLSLAPPKGTASIFKLKGDGLPGPLDVFAHASNDAAKELATWHTQVLPPLSLSARPTALDASQGGITTFQVTDVGDPVEGVSITVAGKTAITDAQGQASIELPNGTTPGTLTVTGSKAGHRSASTRLTMRPPASKRDGR
jgi:hypothetical protein